MLPKSKSIVLGIIFSCFLLNTVTLSAAEGRDSLFRELKIQHDSLIAFQAKPYGKSDSIYWSRIVGIKLTLAALGKFEEAYYLNNLIADYNAHIADKKNSGLERLIQKAIAFCLIPVVFVFVFFTFVVYRNRRELVFRKKEAEIELKALRSQMNPHFIFNCMNSIYKFMYDNNSREAGNYLIRFSKLIRSILENSNNEEIVLVKEIEALELYIQMEQLRLSHRFNYVINYINDLDPEDYMIPPLILQPFVENSIWHGLNNREKDGMLEIAIEKEGPYIRYAIVDNGKIANEKSQNDIKEMVNANSMGSSLTKERINLLNRSNEVKSYYKETLLYDSEQIYAGRKVELFIPYD